MNGRILFGYRTALISRLLSWKRNSSCRPFKVSIAFLICRESLTSFSSLSEEVLLRSNETFLSSTLLGETACIYLAIAVLASPTVLSTPGITSSIFKHRIAVSCSTPSSRSRYAQSKFTVPSLVRRRTISQARRIISSRVFVGVGSEAAILGMLNDVKVFPFTWSSGACVANSSTWIEPIVPAVGFPLVLSALVFDSSLASSSDLVFRFCLQGTIISQSQISQVSRFVSFLSVQKSQEADLNRAATPSQSASFPFHWSIQNKAANSAQSK